VRLAGDVHGATILDVGGGIGGIELDLLALGADRATNVELSGGYEEAAAELIAERALEARVDRRVGDFVTADVEPHDVVVMHRVVCCYPDVDLLVGAAAAHTGRLLLLTYPRDRPLVRAGLRSINLWLRLSRCGFRTYAHSVARITAAAAAHGLRLEQRERNGPFWETAAYRRMPV
jgi:magnesium-protoporphyrin O-methyltransferase